MRVIYGRSLAGFVSLLVSVSPKHTDSFQANRDSTFFFRFEKQTQADQKWEIDISLGTMLRVCGYNFCI